MMAPTSSATQGTPEPPSAHAADALLALLAARAKVPAATVIFWKASNPWLAHSIGLYDPAGFDLRSLAVTTLTIVDDPERDPAFATSSLVHGLEHVRFIACAPICSPGGTVLGTLALLDRKARDDREQIEQTLRDGTAIAAVIALQHGAPEGRTEQIEILERALDAAQSGIAVCSLNSDGTLPRFLYVNNAIVGRSGISRGQFLSGFPGVFDRDPNLEFARHIARHMLDNDETPFETEYQGANGVTYWLNVRCSRLDSRPGEEPHYIVVIEDITERRGRTEITRLFESVIADTSDLVLITDATRPSEGGPFIRYLNGSMSAFLQRPGDELIGQPTHRLVSEFTEPRTLRALDHNMEHYLPIANEVAFRRGDGERIWSSFTARALRNERGEPTYWLFTGRDITARKQEYRQSAQFAQALDSADEPIVIYEVVPPYELEISHQNRAAIEQRRYLARMLLGAGNPSHEMLVQWHRLEQGASVQRMLFVPTDQEPGAWVSLELRPTLDETGALASLTAIQHVPGARTRIVRTNHPMLFAIALADELLGYHALADRMDALATILEAEWRAQVSFEYVDLIPFGSDVVIGAEHQVAEFLSAVGVLAPQGIRVRVTWDFPLPTDMTTALRLFLEAISKRNLIA